MANRRAEMRKQTSTVTTQVTVEEHQIGNSTLVWVDPLTILRI